MRKEIKTPTQCRHFAQTVGDIDQIKTSVGKIAPRAEKLRDMNFGEE